LAFDCERGRLPGWHVLGLSYLEKFCHNVLRFVLIFWLRSVGIFRSLPSAKLVSQTSRLGKHPPCSQLKPKALIRNEVAKTTPLYFTSNAGSVPERWLARALLVRPFAAVGWLGGSLS
jgi:hypothetical protein